MGVDLLFYSVVTLFNMKSKIPLLQVSSTQSPVRLPKTWPHVIRNGDVAVKIYKNTGCVSGKRFTSFLLGWSRTG